MHVPLDRGFFRGFLRTRNLNTLRDIHRVIQEGRSETEGEAVPLIMTTHDACERAMRQAGEEISRLPVVREAPQFIRIESLA